MCSWLSVLHLPRINFLFVASFFRKNNLRSSHLSYSKNRKRYDLFVLLSNNYVTGCHYINVIVGDSSLPRNHILTKRQWNAYCHGFTITFNFIYRNVCMVCCLVCTPPYFLDVVFLA